MTNRHYFFLALIACAPLASAAPDAEGESCATIEDAEQRLACYDRAFGDAAAVTGNQADGEDAAAATIEEKPSEEEPVSAISEFGAEQLPPEIPDFIEATLVGDFNGWDGNTIFRLDNGQVWRQTKNYIRPYQPREPIPSPRVTIEKGLFATYNLRVEGVKRIVQVRRVE